ncbi:MAG: nitrogen fixation protein NifX [Methylococcales bacterium]|nr:nitrogen fixation protein NifX [Methylococcaceae bacterium]
MNGQAPFSRELALRIGLAAHALPDTDAKRLLSVLTDCIGLPITEEKIADLSLKKLKTAKTGEFIDFDDALLAQALNILKGVQQSNDDSWETLSYQDGDMPGSVRIAVASNDGLNVDGHFGAAQQFMIFQVSADEIRLIYVRDTDIPAGLIVDDKNLYRAELIQDCQVLYIASVGGPAAAKIVKLGIHPIKLEAPEPIADVLEQLQSVLAGTPPPWLAKVMGIGAADRFRFEREATG